MGIIITSIIGFSFALSAGDYYRGLSYNQAIGSPGNSFFAVQSVHQRAIQESIQSFQESGNITGLLSLADSLIKSLGSISTDSSEIAGISYYIGVCELLASKQSDALRWLRTSVEIKKRLKEYDDQYIKGLYNIGISYMNLGNPDQAFKYMNDYIDFEQRFYGDNSREVAESYSTLIGFSLECKDYQKFRDFTFKTLDILGKNKDALRGLQLSSFYHSVGAGYAQMGDYSKAMHYLEESESLSKNFNNVSDQEYINLINTLAITYGSLGLTGKEEEYFQKGIELALRNNSYMAFNMINTYAIGLGASGNAEKGKILLKELVDKAANVYGTDSPYYIEVLRSYAEYSLNYLNDPSEALKLFSVCHNFITSHPGDINLHDRVLIGYAEALFINGQSNEALKYIQDLLFNRTSSGREGDIYANPVIDSLKTENRYLRILQLKYKILHNIYTSTSDQKVLEAAAGTSELMLSLIDKIRVSISEEESRLILGSRFRDSYLFTIHDYELCYRNTGNHRFLEKAFEYAEKCKAAGLLAATRELNAIQFHIPPDIAVLEQNLQMKIAFYNSKISLENEKEVPDQTMLNDLNEKLIKSLNNRDSLVMTFEKDYPVYYSLKYNSKVLSMKEIIPIVGRNNNYLNYVVSDSLLFIFIVNRKHQDVLSIRINSGFFDDLRKYRYLLSNPSESELARTKFNEFQRISNKLYNILVDPVRKYFISENLLVSPDNMLSYLPFETLITAKYKGDDILYRKLDYLMNEFNISYVYSATFMKEIVGRKYSKTTNTAVFAPVYTSDINTDSIFMRRQSSGGILHELPYAREEAEYVSEITGGTLYLNTDAKESVFKNQAGRFDIIHLAMHTYLDDQNPMNSAMIFDQGKDFPEDGLLYTYEVYGIPLKARMIVLSSCNTGTGILSSGEGILSLARGFLYSGSQSVVMSMWEIEDKSGTDIVKMFYNNLKSGKSKSESLREARKSFLKSASQLRSHPYFWATLVIYGENSPVFPGIKVLIISVIGIILISAGIFYFFSRRKYS